MDYCLTRIPIKVFIFILIGLLEFNSIKDSIFHFIKTIPLTKVIFKFLPVNSFIESIISINSNNPLCISLKYSKSKFLSCFQKAPCFRS